MSRRRAAAWTVAGLIATGAVVVVVAGAATPGYDAATRTVSRLATDRMPFAVAVDAAMVAIAAACALMATAVGSQAATTRALLGVAACCFVVTALVHLDDASTLASWTHRGASAIAVLSLTGASAAAGLRYGVVSRVAAALEAALLVAGSGLLLTPFAWWGAWERVALAVPFAWMVAVALKIASADDTASMPSAAPSSAGL